MDSVIKLNSAGPLASGGGIASFGTLTILRSTISDNGATTVGGLWVTGATLILESSIVRNFGAFGVGGIQASGPLTVQNGTIALNQENGGGATGILGSGTIINSTISENGAIDGHSGALAGSFTLVNTILAGNLRSEPGADCSARVTSLGHNVIGDPTGCSIDLQATDLTGDPGLDEYTEDELDAGSGHFPLRPDSQAINAGDRDACPATDQLGNPRVGRCDIGAVEFQGRKVRLIVRREVIRAGRSLTVRWRNIPEPAATDWIGLYSPGSPNTAFLEWIYVSCSTTPADPRPRGSCHFTVPASLVAGTYELRLLADDGYEHLASSHTFTVKEP